MNAQKQPWSTTKRVEKWFAKYIRDADGCWQWNGFVSASGYGQCGIGGRTLLVHRVMYEYFIAPIPTDLEIDHLCRNRACVNPWHLEPVSRQVNTDRRHHASQKGEANPFAKLTTEDVLMIRRSRNVSDRTLATQLGVAPRTVGLARSGQQWSHVAEVTDVS